MALFKRKKNREEARKQGSKEARKLKENTVNQEVKKEEEKVEPKKDEVVLEKRVQKVDPSTSSRSGSENPSGSRTTGSDGKKTDTKVGAAKPAKTSFAYRVLRKPQVTEKAAHLSDSNKYVFEVSLDSNKIEIAKAVNDLYKVKPLSVNIVRMSGKKVRFGRRFGKRKSWKKAIVTLKKGDKIEVYGN
jgi:large subunit ribosomal protein L23